MEGHGVIEELESLQKLEVKGTSQAWEDRVGESARDQVLRDCVKEGKRDQCLPIFSRELFWQA